MDLFISPKNRAPINAEDVADWENPIVNLSRFDAVTKNIVKGDDEGEQLHAIQFRRYETDSNGGNEWVSWLYQEAETRDAEYKRLRRLLQLPAWMHGMAIVAGM